MIDSSIVVVGAGPAGCAAALELAARGLPVTLVDEHPQSMAAMSLDAPYFYGTRLSPALAKAGANAETVLGNNPALMECFEAGVEVLTSTCVWGLFLPGENTRHLGSKQLGLADESRSWMAPFEDLVLASGARDLVLSFPGWELPGVVGVKGATALLSRYQALGGQELLVLGTGNVALRFARRALEAGLAVVGLVDPADAVSGDRALAEALQQAGVPFYLGHTLAAAEGKQEVIGARLVRFAGGTRETVSVACDSIVMAMGVVPNVELAAVAGCELRYEAGLGGWVPALDADGHTTREGVYVVGSGAGIRERMQVSEELARGQGRRAARAIARRRGVAVEATEAAVPAADESPPAMFPPTLWLESLRAAGGEDVWVCQCEEVTRREFLTVTPPRYLDVPAWTEKDLHAAGREATDLNQDFLKRMTRVGMGHCQGRRCREHAAMLLAGAAQVSLSTVRPGSYRMPVRPLPLSVLAEAAGQGVDFVWPPWSWLHYDADMLRQLGL